MKVVDIPFASEEKVQKLPKDEVLVSYLLCDVRVQTYRYVFAPSVSTLRIGSMHLDLWGRLAPS